MQFNKYTHTHTHTHTAGTRQLRLEGPVSVHAHRTEGVTGSKGREGVNGVEVGSESGAGTETGTGAGAGTGTGTLIGTGSERERERWWRRPKEHKMGMGTGEVV